MPDALRRGKQINGKRVRPEDYARYEARARALRRTLPEHIMALLEQDLQSAVRRVTIEYSDPNGMFRRP